MLIKKSDFERLFYALYGTERRLIISALPRFAGYNGVDVDQDVPVLCWRTIKGRGVVVGMANEEGKFEDDVNPAKLLLKVVEYLSKKQTPHESIRGVADVSCKNCF